MSTNLRFTTADLELLPDDGNRYEIVDGELYVTTQPHFRHQYTCDQIIEALRQSSRQSGAGTPVSAPGLIFSSDQAVAPDVVWIRRGRLDRVLGEDGKLHAAPDLIVEVLLPGKENEERDREVKLKLYSRRGVREYWIVDWREPTIEVYRRSNAELQLVATLTAEDTLTSPLVPSFAWRVRDLCAAPST
jgi:Uma2 family endonuclease